VNISVWIFCAPDNQGSIPSRNTFRLTVGLTNSPVQWVVGSLSPGFKWLGHEAYHSPLHLAPRLGTYGAMLPLLCISSWPGA